MSRNVICRMNSCLIAASAAIALSCSIASAADYLLTASGPLSSTSSFSDTFDGTNHGTLPSHLNLDALVGGSFRASFRFSTSVLDGDLDPDTAYYDLSGLCFGLTYELLDSNGAVVHQGSNFVEEGAYIANNDGNPPYVVDQVFLSSLVNTTTNIHVPAPLYSSTPDIFSAESISCFSYVDANTNYLNDLQIPIDSATYLAFPNKIFEVYNFFGDGDTVDQINQFQYLEDIVDYDITSLTVTAVPEPGLVCVLAQVASVVALRRLRRARSR